MISVPSLLRIELNKRKWAMRLYRMITGPDDNEFCHRVSKALSNGWELAGSASLTFDAVRGRTMCGQPVTKDVPNVEYSSDIKLGDY